ncbi:hypothetical protein BDZ88DRAFT_332403 [Geranomyces variabilis]|nr:hypothetical protein BDZ88DRAFT_332403 [Geranomyces variabilis]
MGNRLGGWVAVLRLRKLLGLLRWGCCAKQRTNRRRRPSMSFHHPACGSPSSSRADKARPPAINTPKQQRFVVSANSPSGLSPLRFRFGEPPTRCRCQWPLPSPWAVRRAHNVKRIACSRERERERAREQERAIVGVRYTKSPAKQARVWWPSVSSLNDLEARLFAAASSFPTFLPAYPIHHTLPPPPSLSCLRRREAVKA